jgi:MauM/NapG family ferredoxin protein
MRRLEKTRRAVQVLSLLSFLFLLASAIGPGRLPGSQLFLEADPLVALSALLSAQGLGVAAALGMVLFALPVVVLGLLTERAFCGWLCPLGTVIDIADRIFGARRAKRIVSVTWLKYCVLAGVLAGAAAGLSLIFLFDPIVLLTRSLTLGLVPGSQAALKRLSDLPGVGVAFSLSAYAAAPQFAYRGALLAALLLGAVLGLSAMGRRFWCRNVCPLGGMLALLSRTAVLRLRFGDACTGCSACAKACKMEAIEAGEKPSYNARECISCYTCVVKCPEAAISVGWLGQQEGRSTQLNVSRRRVLQASAVGIGWALLGKLEVASSRAESGATLGSPHLLRPPGSVPEDEFVKRCVRCSECVKVCPNGALQPAMAEAGASGFWTPVLVPRINYCTEACDACGRVCPTHAIEQFSIKEKKWLFIGTAVIDRSRCLEWNSDKTCLVCDEQCTYKAVYWDEVDGERRPFVNDQVCVGCGICEKKCPVGPEAAIRVFSFSDKRDWPRERQKKFRASARPLGKDYTLLPID